MTEGDTQWARYQVFHQEESQHPHINAGTVHAADSEMALQNARDVFVRRPGCVSLWVAKAGDIRSLTAEELEIGGPPAPTDVDAPQQAYQVFQKLSRIGSHEHVGTVEATSSENALATAHGELKRDGVLVWWVVPDSSISKTEADDIDSLFQPASSKLYRDEAFYHTVTLMRRLREQRGENS